MSRKVGPLPRLTSQDFIALAEHSAKVERDGKRAATLAVVQTLDTKDFEETQARCHPRASATLSAPSR